MPIGSYEICHVCGWEDDISQLRFPMSLGANKVNLLEAQQNFEKYGYSNRALIHEKNVKTEEYTRDPDWRPINLTTDKILAAPQDADYFDRQPGVIQEESINDDKVQESYPDDLNKLQYWKYQ